jgi:tetratricopeptide (TPR) repeat protein
MERNEGFSWADHIAWLVEVHGSLAAVAQRLAALRAYKDDAQSIERALRRLRGRGPHEGGIWGARIVRAFGLPEATAARVRWLGTYHSGFSDLPLSVCEDLLREWDRPPVAESPEAATWLALGRAVCSARRGDAAGARAHLARALATKGSASAAAQAEFLLTAAFLERDVGRLAAFDELLAALPEVDRACLHARAIDIRARALRLRGQTTAALSLLDEIADDAPPFALARREYGRARALAACDRIDEAITAARAAAEHAGDGGHLRHRAIALSLLSELTGAESIARRARSIAGALGDRFLRPNDSGPHGVLEVA